ncbi:response regulator transcription factor [Paenibacillus faecis]|uniref:Response regulator transcription factor n=2 Tax=Paenibacillus faecis TaxID=862114 RepID=A0A5D0CXD1_9BACL|nr:response regulator transcription factor [Paenibacillus faecis]
MRKIMIVEDDETISFGLTVALRKNGFLPLACATLAEGRAMFGENDDLALVLLDWNLPDGTGYGFCREVKAVRDVPLIFLTVRDDEQDIVQGLDSGADDYIVKPFQLSVLLSRINAVLRRTKDVGQTVMRCGEIMLDKQKAAVWVAERELLLTAGEYRLLTILLENKNQTLTRPQLLDRLWDAEGNFVNDNTLTVTMKRLREKLNYPACLKTIRGIGYRMEELS